MMWRQPGNERENHMATVSDILVLSGGEFFLPGIITSPGKPTHIRGREDIRFDLPSGVTGQGLLSFVVWTNKGNDDGIDVEFDTSGYSWKFTQPVYFGLQLPIGGLTTGSN